MDTYRPRALSDDRRPTQRLSRFSAQQGLSRRLHSQPLTRILPRFVAFLQTGRQTALDSLPLLPQQLFHIHRTGQSCDESVPPNADNNCDTHHLWSAQPGGGNWLFADGSVRFLPYRSNAILPALATRSGGEVVNDVD